MMTLKASFGPVSGVACIECSSIFLVGRGREHRRKILIAILDTAQLLAVNIIKKSHIDVKLWLRCKARIIEPL